MKDYSITLKIMAILADGEFHSGEHLGQSLGMSRAAINQHLKILETWGVSTYRVTGKGYCLSAPINLLDQNVISQQYHTDNVEVIPVIDSTNQYLLDNIDRLTTGDVCLAEYQEAGRGRRGGKWFSPFGANLYLSMYWRLEQGPAAAMGLSLVVGIVIAETLIEFGCHDVKVKWPNDLYINSRKLAGILVEMTGKTGDIAHIVIGAGINIAMKSEATSSIDQSWTSLYQEGVITDRNALSAAIITNLRAALQTFETQGMAPFLPRWHALDNFLDRQVKLIIGDREIYGIERGINEFGALMLESEGEVKAWVGGEISLRAAN
ncbi:bifunctional biotin--[acetyl-CoA-carboxylase] ligase/biotin operon repressor BirA [Tatumella ptyseos]|uniref:bifunctional biotin--[acetyl-CoA-carboxylase] ligase/biotin operon repressor BirA n=1 Tax=Tatumella ptyseos TaxID=82987 RepID=UPI0026EA0C72|nr:bifunctional biotin--[acetyl-CoA-carboxylase] ligase/biotin operon repressor BirA [Tatumella ptyseos]WKX26338.1 bifunctional biotin--[acetyl-CoA-carboxylase] ligase/biotin operon repressor BirA [Tatumella ptyseos]